MIALFIIIGLITSMVITYKYKFLKGIELGLFMTLEIFLTGYWIGEFVVYLIRTSLSLNTTL